MPSQIDSLVGQIRERFWELAPEKAAQHEDPKYLEDDLREALSEAVETNFPQDPKVILRVLRWLLKADFSNLIYELDFRPLTELCSYEDGEELLYWFIRDLLEQLVWQTDKMIARLLPNANIVPRGRFGEYREASSS